MPYMIELADVLSKSRPEGSICGWYHSHPFEPLDDGGDHCWFSDTDVTNQNQWQTQWEKLGGDPFIGIVIDPQTSQKNRAMHFGAFRNYPNEWKNPIPNQCPDGQIIANDNERRKKWGSAWRSYYRLQVSYFTNTQSQDMFSWMTKDVKWIKDICPSAFADHQINTKVLIKDLHDLANNIQDQGSSNFPASGGIHQTSSILSSQKAIRTSKDGGSTKGDSPFDATKQRSCHLAVNAIAQELRRVANKSIFGTNLEVKSTK